MLNIFLTQSSVPIIGTFAKLLGYVMQFIYKIFADGFGIENIGLCIIVFTLVVKLLMIPLTVKQQKFSKLSALMNPELQAIQKKYKDRRDTDSMMKMNEETQAVYQKYGTSPTGSCLQLLIQMPILFSLYYIVSGIPAYVPRVYNYYEPVSVAVVADYDTFDYMKDAYDTYVLKDGEKDQFAYIEEVFFKESGTISIKKANKSGSVEDKQKKTVDALSKYSEKEWNKLIKCYENIDELKNSLKTLTDENWEELKKDLKGSDLKTVERIEEAVKNDTELYADENVVMNEAQAEVINSSKKKVMKINEFGPINLSQTPKDAMGIAILIPVFSFLMQWLSIAISTAANKEQMKDNPMNNSMKVMNVMMPLMSAFIAFTVPSGLGLYWAFNGFFQVITQLCINAYFKKVDVEDIIAANVEKMNKKKAKRGIDSKQVTAAAGMNTKTIKNKANVQTADSVQDKNRKYKKGSMAEKANMVKELNDKNRK